MPEIKRQASLIVDKWARSVYNIQSEYDPTGKFDDNYRVYQERLLQQKQEKQKALQIEEMHNQGESENDDSDSPTPGKTKRGKTRKPIDESKDIQRGRMGIMLPERNAFEFVHRPKAKEINVHDRKKEGESGRYKLQKTLLQMRRANTRQTTSKEMATVKTTY